MRVRLAVPIVLATACAVPTPSRAPVVTPAPVAAAEAHPAVPFSWTNARHEARAAFDAHDYVSYKRQLDALYARSGSPWVLIDLARAAVLLGDRPGALARLEGFARMGLSYDVAADAKLAPLREDPSFPELVARLAANERPVAHAHAVLPLPHQELVTEDLAYDAPTRTFFVSSVHHRKIIAVGPDGHARDLVAERPDASSILGLALAGGRLWATTSAMPLMDGYDAHAAHTTALLAFDPRDGALLQRVELPAGADAGAGDQALTDLAVDARGAVYVSDAAGGAEYVLSPGASALVRIAGPEELVSPQTPAPSADGKRLFIPDYVRGIAVVDLATRRLEWMGHPDDVALLGIDGLYVDGATFLGVQNGVSPPRVARLFPSADGTQIVRVEVLERATPGLGEPTHGVLVGGSFYFLANAGWTRYADDGHLLPDAPADAPAIWALAR